LPQPPSTIVHDSQPGIDAATNEAMPRFGGRANPGETIKISVDGDTTTVAPTPNGSWEWTSSELANGEHEFEMWTEDAEGNESDHIEWENDIDADEQTREWQRARNEQWKQQGAQEFLGANDALTPPKPISAGGGGGAPEPMTDPAPTGPTQERPQTGDAGGGAPGGAGAGAPSPQGLEKGNALQVG